MDGDSLELMRQHFASLNQCSVDARPMFGGHRLAQMRLLLGAAPKGGRVCVLGAGNCNDLDLPELAEHFAEVHLVDIDEVALRTAVRGQSSEVKARIRPHVVDLSGILDDPGTIRSAPAAYLADGGELSERVPSVV